MVDQRPDCATCGCPAKTHEHYRAGSDCGRHVPCRRYQRPRMLMRARMQALLRRKARW